MLSHWGTPLKQDVSGGPCIYPSTHSSVWYIIICLFENDGPTQEIPSALLLLCWSCLLPIWQWKPVWFSESGYSAVSLNSLASLESTHLFQRVHCQLQTLSKAANWLDLRIVTSPFSPGQDSHPIETTLMRFLRRKSSSFSAPWKLSFKELHIDSAYVPLPSSTRSKITWSLPPVD